MRFIFLLSLPLLLTFGNSGTAYAQASPERMAFDSLLRLAESYPDDSIARKSWLLHRAGLMADAEYDLPAAVEVTQRALELRLRNEPELSMEVVLSAFNIGAYLSEQGEYREGMQYYDMVLNRAPNRKEGVAYYQIARNHARMGAFSAAENAFAAAADRSPFRDDSYALGLLKKDLGRLHLGKNTSAGGLAAIGPLEEAYALQQEAGTEEYPTDYEQMECLTYLGWANTEAGNYERALACLQTAEQLAVTLGVEDEDLTAILHNTGLTYRRMGETDVAMRYYRAALSQEFVLAEDGPPNTAVAASLNNISTAKLRSGELDSALFYAQEALQWRIEGYHPDNLKELPGLSLLTDNALDLLTLLQDKARAHDALAENGETEHYEYALAAYRRADELLDQMRRNQLLEDTRNYWRADARKLYSEALSVAVSAGDPVSVFYFMEKARARLLLDELTAGRAEEQLPEAVQERLATTARRARQATGTPADLQAFRQLQDSIFTAFPAYERSRIGAPPPDPAQLKKILGDEALVQYFVGEEQTIALTWSASQGLVFKELSPATVWREALTVLQAGAANPYTAFPVEEARFLYAQLVAPLELPAGLPITFVPDADLYLLPFGALLTNAPEDGENYDRWPWLAAERRVNHAFSVQLLDFAKEQRGRGNGKALALAPVARLAAGGPLNTSLELPATLRTARHLTTLFPADTLINAAANRINFRELADAYSLLHLGTHAYLGDADEGGFLLHNKEQARYTITDMAEHQFTADLVVIGACETGQGEQIVGEGVASLGRAFARRGAPSLVMSLWSIDDAATAALLNASYDQLAAGVGPASALYAAGENYRAEVTNPGFGHPYYWAGLVAYGPDVPLSMGQSAFGIWPWLLGGSFVLGILFLFFRRR